MAGDARVLCKRSGMEDGICTVGDLDVQATADLAVVIATIYYGDRSEQGINGMHNQATFVRRRLDGIWKIIPEHTSVPLDETTQPILNREPTPVVNGSDGRG